MTTSSLLDLLRRTERGRKGEKEGGREGRKEGEREGRREGGRGRENEERS